MVTIQGPLGYGPKTLPRSTSRYIAKWAYEAGNKLTLQEVVFFILYSKKKVRIKTPYRNFWFGFGKSVFLEMVISRYLQVYVSASKELKLICGVGGGRGFDKVLNKELTNK